MKRSFSLLALALLLAGCDSDPRGPGDLTGTFTGAGDPPGGVVLEVIGSGIVGFSGEGGTKVFWAPQENPSTYRVIVVGEGSSDLSFLTSVEDVGKRMPRATVVSVVNQENIPLPVTGDYQVKFRR